MEDAAKSFNTFVIGGQLHNMVLLNYRQDKCVVNRMLSNIFATVL